MKRGLLLTMVMLAAIFATFSFFIPGKSSALLTADDQFVIDGTNNMYWIKNLNLFTYKNYVEQIYAINNLSIEGYSGFHLASNEEVGILFNYGGAAVFPKFDNPDPWYNDYLIGRSSTLSSAGHFTPKINIGGTGVFIESVGDGYNTGYLSAWVVGSKVTPTPIPGALVLFGSGLLGLVGLGRKRFKK